MGKTSNGIHDIQYRNLCQATVLRPEGFLRGNRIEALRELRRTTEQLKRERVIRTSWTNRT